MTSHKDRIKAINTKGFSLPRDYYGVPQNSHSISHMSAHQAKLHRSQTERQPNDEDSEYQQPLSPVYLNNQSEQVKFELNGKTPSQKSPDRRHMQHSYPYLADGNTNNTNQSYLTMHSPQTFSNNQILYKSQSLNALKTKEPSKVLGKTSIQQEYHDKKVQKRLRGFNHGQSRRPCMIATIMFCIFGLLFIVGLTLICLTYIYKNMFLSLDKGEMIGPVIMAGSFIFFGVGCKFVYDAHRIARKERKTVAYRGYDRHYVGLKSGRNSLPNEHLVSGTATDIGTSRVPNRKKAPTTMARTIEKSNQKLYSQLDGNSEL